MNPDRKNFPMNLSPQQIADMVASAVSGADAFQNPEGIKTIFSLLDITSLNTTDTSAKMVSLCEKINDLSDCFPGFPNVAAVCVYPVFIADVKKNLSVPRVKIASVAGGFPSSQTYLKIKLQEAATALNKGADEIDIVLSLGLFFEGKHDALKNEIREIKKMLGNRHLKVILETGVLLTPNEIYSSSMLAMEAGADFIKTSTGKLQPAASLEAVAVMCTAINDFYQSSGKKVGIKPAGGISTTFDASGYLNLVSSILGKDWLSPDLFRFGASRLANDLLTTYQSLETGKTNPINYF
jgi:deoxyribose-phosphate aldolase